VIKTKCAICGTEDNVRVLYLNIYSFRYWFNYAALNPGIKRAVIKFADVTRLSNVKIPLWAGNLAILAQKPAN
jgi:hypothetical protein